jgi:type IV fimbrial biogenesis protein FimT
MKSSIFKRQPGTHQRGFTIVELMVTVCLAAILFGFAIPSFRRMIVNNRLVTQTNDLIGAINYARSEAITQNTSVTFCRAADETATTCVASTANWTFWIVRNNGSATVSRRGGISTYTGGIKVTSGLTGDAMTYGSDGLGRNGTTTTTLMGAQTIVVCSPNINFENIRTVTPGAGSRLSTVRTTGTC